MSKNTKQIYDDKVCIVGGGPVGLGLSLILAKYKISSIVLEVREQPTSRDESRAITWMPRGLEFLSWLGIEKKFLDQGVIRYYHQFENAEQKLLTWALKDVESPYSYSIQLPQHDTEVLLEKYARETGLVDVRRGHEVVSVAKEQNQIIVKVQHKEGTYELQAPWGVACDGAKSNIREALQIHKSWRDYGIHSAVADFEMDCGRDKELSNIVLDPKRPYGFFYFAPGRWRIIYRINEGEDKKEVTTEAFVTRLLKEKLPNAKIHRFLWASSFRLGQGQSETYQKGRWFLAGDAAHAMGPSAGAGMMVGLLGAWRLGWRLALAMENHPDAVKLLQDYSREQHEGANEIQDNNAMIFKNIAIRNPVLARVRSFMMRNVLSRVDVIGKVALEKEALLRQTLPVEHAFDHHLPGRWLQLKNEGKWMLGRRIPYLKNDKSLNPLHSTGLYHTIFSIGRYDPEQEEKIFQQLFNDLDVPIEKTLVVPEKKSSYRVNHKNFVFAIARPDQHIVALVKLL